MTFVGDRGSVAPRTRALGLVLDSPPGERRYPRLRPSGDGWTLAYAPRERPVAVTGLIELTVGKPARVVTAEGTRELGVLTAYVLL